MSLKMFKAKDGKAKPVASSSSNIGGNGGGPIQEQMKMKKS